MPFHRFEDYEAHYLTPHLSTGKAPILEGRYMYFCLLQKEAGTGSELHYHPNELLIFPIEGKINAVVGRDRRIVEPGTFIHVPANARHSMKATEDGPLSYLYIKDQTWSVVGIAEDEAPPDKPMTVDEVNRIHDSGEWAGQEKSPEQSQAILDGLGECFYPIIDGLDAPASSANRVTWIEGERLAFGFFEYPAGYMHHADASEHEQFMYVIEGGLNMRIDNDTQETVPGSVIEVPRGAEMEFSVTDGAAVRFVSVRAMPSLEDAIDRTHREAG